MPYLQIFNSLLPNRIPIFNKSDELTYGMVYTFREFVTKGSFFVFVYNKYLRLLQKSGTASFLLISNEKHALSIELHHGTFIMLMVDNDLNNQLHNIIIDTEVPTAKFNINALLDTIRNTLYESIHESLKSNQQTQDDGSALPTTTFHQQLARVQVSLVILLTIQVSKERVPYNIVVDHSNNASKKSMQKLGGGYQTPTPNKAQVDHQKIKW